jgi:hypothetical protein
MLSYFASTCQIGHMYRELIGVWCWKTGHKSAGYIPHKLSFYFLSFVRVSARGVGL